MTGFHFEYLNDRRIFIDFTRMTSREGRTDVMVPPKLGPDKKQFIYYLKDHLLINKNFLQAVKCNKE